MLRPRAWILRTTWSACALAWRPRRRRPDAIHHFPCRRRSAFHSAAHALAIAVRGHRRRHGSRFRTVLSLAHASRRNAQRGGVVHLLRAGGHDRLLGVPVPDQGTGFGSVARGRVFALASVFL